MPAEHLTPATLRALPCAPLSGRERARLVRHLSTACPQCWLEVARLAGSFPPPAAAGEGDLVTLALWRALPGDALRPAHRLALLGARTERLGFARLVLEEARELGMRTPHRAETLLAEARRLLAAARLATVDAARAHDLDALAWVYAADARRILGQHFEAAAGFKAARRALASGSGWAQVDATLDELRAYLPWREGKEHDAMEALTAAAGKLTAPGLEGRRAEVLGRQAAFWQQLGAEAQALELLDEALALLPEGQSPGVRLFLLHNAASANADLGQARAGWVCFEAALPLYEPHGHELLRAQRFWVRGKLERVDGRFEAAEQSLRTAAQALLDLERGSMVVGVLLDLARVYVQARQRERFVELARLFETLSTKPFFLKALRRHLGVLLARARRRGVPMPELEALVEKLSAAVATPVA